MDDLRSGALHLDAVMRLSPHLSPENSDAILDRAAGASKREVMILAAQLGPMEPAPERDVIRYLPPAVPPSAPARGPEFEFASAVPSRDSSEESIEVVPPPSRVRLSFTADDGFLVKLERLKGLRRHKFPAGRLEDILEEAISGLLERIDPDLRASKSGRKGRIRRTRALRHIPEEVKAEVWKRDGGRCAYSALDGRRCESREALEYDHVMAWALGGPSDRVENIRLLCRTHNQRLARRLFGPRFVRTH